MIFNFLCFQQWLPAPTYKAQKKRIWGMYSMAIEQNPAPFMKVTKKHWTPQFTLPCQCRRKGKGWVGALPSCGPPLSAPVFSSTVRTQVAIPLKSVEALTAGLHSFCVAVEIFRCVGVIANVVQKCWVSWELLREEPEIAGPLLCWHTEPALLCGMWPWDTFWEQG